MLRMHIISKVKWRRGGWGLPSIIIYLEEIIFNNNNNNHLDFWDIPFQPREGVLSARASSPNSWWDFQSCDTSDSCPPQSPLSRPTSSRHIIYMDLGRSLLPALTALKTKFKWSLAAFLQIYTGVLQTITSKIKEIIYSEILYSPLLLSSCSLCCRTPLSFWFYLLAIATVTIDPIHDRDYIRSYFLRADTE